MLIDGLMGAAFPASLRSVAGKWTRLSLCRSRDSIRHESHRIGELGDAGLSVVGLSACASIRLGMIEVMAFVRRQKYQGRIGRPPSTVAGFPSTDSRYRSHAQPHSGLKNRNGTRLFYTNKRVPFENSSNLELRR